MFSVRAAREDVLDVVERVDVASRQRLSDAAVDAITVEAESCLFAIPLGPETANALLQTVGYPGIRRQELFIARLRHLLLGRTGASIMPELLCQGYVGNMDDCVRDLTVLPIVFFDDDGPIAELYWEEFVVR